MIFLAWKSFKMLSECILSSLSCLFQPFLEERKFLSLDVHNHWLKDIAKSLIVSQLNTQTNYSIKRTRDPENKNINQSVSDKAKSQNYNVYNYKM